MRRGPKLKPIILTAEENERLLEWTRRHSTSQALALRARIVLACQHDGSNRQIGRQSRVTAQRVGKWRSRFQRARLDGLLDEPRPGAPRTISDSQVERVIAKTLHGKPREATHWSSRMMAMATGLSQSAAVRIWHAFGLQPHRARDLQAFHRPGVHRESARCRGLVPQSAGSRLGAVCGREEPDSGTRPHTADSADDAGGAGTAHT